MAFDGFVVRALIHELSNKLSWARLDKIHQPLPRDLLFTFRSGGENRRLLLSANPSYPRIHLDELYPFDNPTEPPSFCMLLRKQLEGARLVSIHQVGNDRIVHLTFETRDELGDLSQRTVIFELMGRHSNILLTDPLTGRILDSIVHVGKSTSSFREVLPGRRYTPPPSQNKHDPFQTSVQEAMAARTQVADLPFAKFLLAYYEGMSPVLAREVEARSQQAENEWGIWQLLLQQWNAHNYQPALVVDREGKRIGFSILPLTHLNGTAQPCADVSEMIARYFREKAEQDVVTQKAGDLARLVQSEIAKNVQKLEKFAQTKIKALEAEQWKIYGELLTANLHAIPSSATETILENYYSDRGESVEIPLDPLLSPIQNAQAYFRRYTKAKKSIPALEEQEQIAKNEIEYLEGILVQLRTATWQEIDQIREELAAEGYLKRARGKRIEESRKPAGKKNRKTPAKEQIPKPAKFISTEGVEIWAGKNNRQNDALTFKLSGSSDTWLHTKNIPGSHVLIRGREFGAATLKEAAELAAYFSKARDSSQVPVDYTLVKHVWKPAGAKPGFVLYEREKTLFVTPKLIGGNP